MPTRVLLVVADATEAQRLAAMLLACGEDVFLPERVATITAALAHLGGSGADAVVVDLGSTPLARLGELKALANAVPDVPVVALTAADDEDLGAAAVQAGAQDYLVRSYITGDVLRRVIRYSRERLRVQRDMETLGREHEMILQSVGEGVLGINGHGLVTFANRKASRLLGMPVDEILGRTGCELMGCETARPDVCGACFGDGSDQNTPAGRLTLRHADGTELLVDCICTAVRRNGLVSGAVMVFRDVTERRRFENALTDHRNLLECQVEERTRDLSREIDDRRRIEAALRESQHRMQAITGNMFEGVMVIDLNGHIVFSNRSADALLDRDGDRLAGRDVDTVFMLAQDGQAVAFRDGPLRRSGESGGVMRNDDAVFLGPDGQPLLVAYACSPLVEGGKRRGVIVSFRDIRQLKKAQQEALQSSKLASVGQLAAGIAHEINTPTQYIGDNLRFVSEAFTVMSDLLVRYRALAEGRSQETTGQLTRAADEGDLDYLMEEAPQAIAQSLDGIGQVARIVLAMKEFSHPGEKEKVAVDLNRAIENTLAVSKNEWKHVAGVALDLDRALPQVVCLPGEMNQVILNLLVNAAHAIQAAQKAGKGTITIATRRHGRVVEITIGDDGTGMDDHVRDRIFDPFFTTKEVGRGSGQGLAICRDVVVAKHGGRISVETEPGRGTAFTIVLPIDGNPATMAAVQ